VILQSGHKNLFRVTLRNGGGNFWSPLIGIVVFLLKAIPGAYLSKTRFRLLENLTIVVAVVRVDRKIELHIRSLFAKETTAQGYRHILEPIATPVDEVGAAFGKVQASKIQTRMDHLNHLQS